VGIASIAMTISHATANEKLPNSSASFQLKQSYGVGEQYKGDDAFAYQVEPSSVLTTSPNTKLEDSPLRGLITSSISQSDALQALSYDAQAAHEGINIASFRLLPEISFSAEIGKTNSLSSTSSAPVDRNVQTGSVNLKWTAFSSGANFATIKSAKYSALAADMEYLAQERRAIMESLSIYLQLLGNQKLIVSMQNTKSRMRRILKSTKTQFKAGFASRTDVAQVNSEIASLNTQIEQARQSLEQNKVIWKSLTGKFASPKLKIPNIAKLIPKSKKRTLQKALNGNPIIFASNYSADAAEQNSKAAMAQFLPNVSLYGNIDTNLNGSAFSNDNREWTAGIQVNIPLVNFAATSQYKQSRHSSLAARYRAKDTKKEVKRDVETNWSNLQSFRKQQSILLMKIKASQKVVKGIGKEVNAGLRPVNDLLREEIKLTQNKIKLFQNEINKVASAYRIAIHFSDLSLNNFKL